VACGVVEWLCVTGLAPSGLLERAPVLVVEAITGTLADVGAMQLWPSNVGFAIAEPLLIENIPRWGTEGRGGRGRRITSR
jgi:hypothetical protein